MFEKGTRPRKSGGGWGEPSGGLPLEVGVEKGGKAGQPARKAAASPS